MTLVIDITCKGSSDGQRVLLEDGDTLKVGRANESLGLNVDPRLSRKHFVLTYCNREIEITHLSQTNPTLVASDGSADFREVAGKQVEQSGCRIIAGSHRFVAVVEAPDSIIEPTLSGEDQAEIWSDVDSEDQGNQFFFDSFAEPNEEAGAAESRPSQPTMRSPHIKPVAKNAVTFQDSTPPMAIPNKSVFPIDDSGSEAPAAEDAPDCEPEPRPTPIKPASPKTPDHSTTEKKIFFPIEDDFFD